MLGKIAVVGRYANTGLLPVLGSLIYNKDSKARILASSVLSTMVFSAIWAGISFAITRDIKTAVGVGVGLLVGLCLWQGVEYNYLKENLKKLTLGEDTPIQMEDKKKIALNAMSESADHTGVFKAVGTLGIAPLTGLIVDKIAERCCNGLKAEEI